MPVHPIDYRYGTPEMRGIWSEEGRLRHMLRSEVALARAEAELGMVPADAPDILEKAAAEVTMKRVLEIEDEIHHDVMAMVRALAERAGDAGEWAHFGATSYDIVDTAIALQMRESLDLLESKLRDLLAALLERARNAKNLACNSRTHGQLGVPTTYGMRFSLWAEEVARHLRRLAELRPRVEVGKFTGAVGTQASYGKKAREVQRLAVESLGLGAVEISNQVVQRDRHSEYVFLLASVATTLDKFCLTIRLLARSELGEVAEAFGEKQVGSSTMPHKRNPITAEQICGLARVVRGFVNAELENNVLWEERDLTNSAPERIILVEASVLCDHVLLKATGLVRGLVIDERRVAENLRSGGPEVMAEAVMMALAPHTGRQRAYAAVRECAQQSRDGNGDFTALLASHPDIVDHLDKKRVEQLLQPENYLGTAVEQVEESVERLRGEFGL